MENSPNRKIYEMTVSKTENELRLASYNLLVSLHFTIVKLSRL